MKSTQVSCPKLPKHLFTIYQQYKYDTEKIAGWLVQSAAKSDYQREKTTLARADMTHTKLTGRARTLARRAAQQAVKDEKQGVYPLRIEEFTDIATHLTQSSPKPILSRSLQATFIRTITARKECNEWFCTQGEDNVLSNKKHQHFVSVLQQTFSILQPCYEPAREISQKLSATRELSDFPSTDHDLGATSTISEHLKLEECTVDEHEHDLVQHKEDKPSQPSHLPTSKIELDEDGKLGDFLFGVWSFLRELKEVRALVQSAWQECYQGNLDMLQAGVLTNTAIDLVRQAESEFDIMLKPPQKLSASTTFVGCWPHIISEAYHHGLYSTNKIRDGQALICGCHMCEDSLHVPWKACHEYVAMLSKQQNRRGPDGANLIAVPIYDIEVMAPETISHPLARKAHNAITTMGRLLPNSIKLSVASCGTLQGDGILHAAQHLLRKRTVPIWVGFAYQVQLDLLQLDRPSSIHPLSDLFSIVQKFNDRYKTHGSYFSSTMNARKETSVASEYVFGALVEHLNSWLPNCAADLDHLITIQSEMPLISESADKLKTLLIHFPLTCASYKIELLTIWQKYGVHLANEGVHVLMMAYLYHTARLLKPTLPLWPDMELLLRLQSPERVFLGGPPTSLAEVESKIGLATGYSITGITGTARDPKAMLPSDSRLRTFELLPLVQNISDQIGINDTRKATENSHQRQSVLASSAYQKTLRRLECTSTSRSADHKNKAPPRIPAAIVTLQTMSRALMSEAPALVFDYHSLHETCWSLCHKLNHKLLDMQQTFSFATSEDTRNCHMNYAIDLALNLISLAISSTKVSRIMKGESHTTNLGLAWYVNFVTSKDKTKQSLRTIKDVMNEDKYGFVVNLVKKLLDDGEDNIASAILEPVISAIETMVERGESDVELKRIRSSTNVKQFGKYLFSEESLSDLYGPGRRNEWEDICLETASDLWLAADENRPECV